MAKQKPIAGKDSTTKKQRGNPDKLVSLATRTPAKRKEIAKQGGIRSGEVKRERKFISAIYAEMLAKEFTVDINEVPTKLTGTGLLEHTIKTALATGGSPAVAMIKEMREATEGTKAMMTVDNVIEIKHTFDPDGV